MVISRRLSLWRRARSAHSVCTILRMIFQPPVYVGGQYFAGLASVFIHFALQIFLRIINIEGFVIRGAGVKIACLLQWLLHRWYLPECRTLSLSAACHLQLCAADSSILACIRSRLVHKISMISLSEASIQ